jgi:hypothetical protein
VHYTSHNKPTDICSRDQFIHTFFEQTAPPSLREGPPPNLGGEIPFILLCG